MCCAYNTFYKDMAPKNLTRISLLAIFLVCITSLFGECDGRKPECVIRAKACADRRINSHKGVGKRDLLPVFQDAVYHYCLDQVGCEEGKRTICLRVGRKFESYTDTKLRDNLVAQCRKWKVSIRYVDDMVTGHYYNWDIMGDD